MLQIPFEPFTFFTITYPLTSGVVEAPQTTSQPVSSIVLCSPLPSGTWRTPGLSIPWCCLPTFSSVRLVFFLLSLRLARMFWPDVMNGRHVDITSVCVSLRCSGSNRVVQLPDGSWHDFLVINMVFFMHAISLMHTCRLKMVVRIDTILWMWYYASIRTRTVERNALKKYLKLWW